MRARLQVTLGLVVMLTVVGCSGSGGGAATPTAGASARVASGPQYYVSLGDSYAAGFQATGAGHGATTTHGFAYQLVPLARAKGYHYTLVNFGCGGATTRSMLSTPGCPTGQYGPGAAHYSSTQTAAAVAFLAAHRGHVSLITVSVGGNDVIPCGLRSDAPACLSTSVGTVGTNLASILRQVRAAAPNARIVGTTYPDVLLGGLISQEASLRSLATLSVTAFKSLINPTLQRAYQAAGGLLVDVTAAFGGYGSLAATTSVPPYGTIPVPAARICTLTYYCQYRDIHPRTPGYAIIARLVAATLPSA